MSPFMVSFPDIVCSISSDGSGKMRLTNPGGWYSATFSPNGEYYVLEYSGPNVPYQTLFSTKSPSEYNSFTNSDT